MDRDRAFLIDIFEAARLAISYIGNKSEEDFFSDTQCQDSVIRRLEIIGEAARRISADTRIAHPELPWSEMIGMRNILIHEYDDVDLPIVWKTIQGELPGIVAKVERLLG